MSARAPWIVLHYTGSRWDGSGLHAVIRQLAQNPACRAILGVAPDFRAEKQPRLPAWRGPAVEADRINPPNLLRAFRVAWQVRRWLAGNPHRIFHGHSRAALLVGLWLHFAGERRVVVSVHVYGRHRWFYRLAKALLGPRLIWYTPAMKRHYGLADVTWRDCMPNALAAPLPATMRRWPGGRPLRLGGAGMMVRWKRWDLVLEALARLPPGVVVEFSHIGGSVDLAESRDYETRLRRRTDELGLGGCVHWLGWQEASEGLLGEVDAVVVPSDGEPFSMIALEALFAGVPVIATRGGGPEDFIHEGVNGWLVPAGDAAALAARIAACTDPATWTGLRVEPEHLRKFSVPETLAARWTEIYAAL